MIKTFNASFYKNGYLLIIAAWLYTISFIFSNYFSYSSSPARVQKQLETYIKNSEEAFGKFTTDTPVIAEITNKALVPKKSRQYLSDDIGLFVYTPDASGNLIIRFWSNNKMLPDIKDLSKPDGKYFSRKLSGQFEFVKKTVYVQNKQVVAAALIPLHWSYFFSNEYLRSEFQAVKGIEKKYKIADTAAEFYIKNGDGKVLFGLKQNKSSASESPGVLSLLFRVLALVLALIYLNMYSLEIVHKKGWIKGFIFLACCVFVLRFLSYHYPFPFEFRNLEFFAATVYASNSLHPSLGDLFINIILLFWLISFLKEVGSEYFKNAKNITGTSGWLMTVILSLSLIALSFIAAGVIRSLIIDSRIPFDVTNFFSLNFYSLCSFIILCFIILTFFHLSHFALLFIYKSTGVPVYAKYLIVTIAGLVYLSFHLNNPVSSGNLVVLFWLLLYMGVMEFRREDIFVPILRSSFFLVWIIFFTASISALIVHENQFVELDQRKRLAQRIITRVDPQAETLLSLEIADINNDFLSSNFARLGYENTNKIIKDSLINANFSGYLTTYDTRLYTFDRNYQPLYNDDPASFENITNIVYNRSRKTRVEDLYYFANEFRGFSYLYQKKILDSAENVQGYFFVVAEPKKYNSQALMPELFKQVNNVESDLDVNYAYAVYSKGEIINNYGDYNFRSFIPKNRYPRQEFIEENKGDVTELWYNAGNSRLVVIVKVGSVFFQAITLFAWLFACLLFVVIAIQVVHYLIRNKFRFRRGRSGIRLSIRTQIQGTIIFISIFSFLVIGIATISFYIKRFGQTNRERLVKTIQVITNDIQSQINSNAWHNDALQMNDPAAVSILEQSIRKVSEIHSVDVNFYNLSGALKVSTQPYIYKKQILSDVMEPTAFYGLHYQNNIRMIQNEKVHDFSFTSVYMPVKDGSGKDYAYLNIPYLNTQKELNQEISSFLVTLINLNAFIFVVAGAIAVFLTNRITGSFNLIASKMRAVNLGKANEEIAWKTNDEIGALVNEYNKMVKKLVGSAHALAKSEREGAWREMARQVAHEIKNPLTPMKLSIQYLQRAIQEKNPNTEELSKKVTATLVEQIDQLAKIASDFSQFANIGNVKFEEFNVNEILTSLVNLYGSNEKVRVTYNPPEAPAIISADRTQINRLFTNLFQNAIEASDGKQVIPITISQAIVDSKLHIKIKDEGSGIPAEKQEKIFTPNFTTKTSGTGLGLAMCKGIVEKANGHIWFDTKEDQGTTFHVLLPLAAAPVG